MSLGFYKSKWNDEIDFSKRKYVYCPKCNCFNVYIETPSVHRSFLGQGVQKLKDEYIVQNSDNSWVSTGKPEFVCSECEHRWSINKEIYWEWV